MEEPLAQPIAVGVAHMADPTDDPLADLRGRQLARLEGVAHPSQAPPHALNVFARDQAVIRKLTESQEAAAVLRAGDQLFEDLLIDRGEEFPHIALQHVPVATSKVPKAVERRVSPLPTAAGITVEHKRRLEDPLQDTAQRVMHDTIPYRSRADQPPLRLENFKRAVGSGRIGSGQQLVLQPARLPFAVDRVRNVDSFWLRAETGENLSFPFAFQPVDVHPFASQLQLIHLHYAVFLFGTQIRSNNLSIDAA